MYMESFSENLKELIAERSISRVAKEIGIPQQTLSRYIHNQREIGIENLCRIADYFDVDLDVLTGRKEFWKYSIGKAAFAVRTSQKRPPPACGGGPGFAVISLPSFCAG